MILTKDVVCAPLGHTLIVKGSQDKEVSDNSIKEDETTLKRKSTRKLKPKEDIRPTRNTLLEKVQYLTDISDTSSSASSESNNENVTSNKGKRLATKKKSVSLTENTQ